MSQALSLPVDTFYHEETFASPFLGGGADDFPQPASTKPERTTPLIVQKFGGSSVADVDKLRRVAEITVAAAQNNGTPQQVITVVSAMGKTTDGLVKLAQEAVNNQATEGRFPQGREYDLLLATGEMVSASLLALILQSMGHKAIALTGPQAGIVTENCHNRARILSVNTQEAQAYLDEGYLVVVTGFQGQNSRGDFTTLGRGGSDTTAVALAAAFGADRCDIYTDVRGVFSTDPRVVPTAHKLEEIAYIEMMELARLGAKVLHPRSVETARRGHVKLCVRSTFELEDEGTMVVHEEAIESDRAVAGIACDTQQVRVALVGVPDQPGVAAKVFGKLAAQNISVDMIIQSLGESESTNDIAFTVNAPDLAATSELTQALKTELGARDVQIDEAIAKVSAVGVGMIDRPGIAAEMFLALSQAGINIKMISTSEIKISCLVDKTHANQAVQALHQQFFG